MFLYLTELPSHRLSRVGLISVNTDLIESIQERLVGDREATEVCLSSGRKLLISDTAASINNKLVTKSL